MLLIQAPSLLLLGQGRLLDLEAENGRENQH